MRILIAIIAMSVMVGCHDAGTSDASVNSKLTVPDVISPSGEVSVNVSNTVQLFDKPTGIATDGNDLYVSDSGNNRIRKIEIATGKVSTIAGGLEGALDDIGTAAGFRFPSHIDYLNGNLYVSDQTNRMVRKIDVATGAVTTLVGSVPGYDDDPAKASLILPFGIVKVGESIYVADLYRHIIRKISTIDAQVATFVGSGAKGNSDGVGLMATFNNPAGIAADANNLYVADFSNHEIRKVAIATGNVSTLAGTGIKGASDGLGRAASFNFPEDITIVDGSLYLTDSVNNSIRRIVIASGLVSTLAGSNATGFADGAGKSAVFNRPRGIVALGGYLYVVDSQNNSIRKISIDNGGVTTLSLSEMQSPVEYPSLKPAKIGSQQPDYVFEYCSEVPAGKINLDSGDSIVDPVRSLVAEVGYRGNRFLANDLAAFASVQLEPLGHAKHGELYSFTDPKSGHIYYKYGAASGYTGQDKVEFMTRFEGEYYKVVINLVVSSHLDDRGDPCPASKLTKISEQGEQ